MKDVNNREVKTETKIENAWKTVISFWHCDNPDITSFYPSLENIDKFWPCSLSNTFPVLKDLTFIELSGVSLPYSDKTESGSGVTLWPGPGVNGVTGVTGNGDINEVTAEVCTAIPTPFTDIYEITDNVEAECIFNYSGKLAKIIKQKVI